MSATPKEGEMYSSETLRQQHPSMVFQSSVASRGKVKSGSPRITTCTFNLRIADAGVEEGCGPIATFVAFPSSAANHSLGTRTSGGGQRQNKYEGAVGITRKSGAKSATRDLVSVVLSLSSWASMSRGSCPAARI